MNQDNDIQLGDYLDGRLGPAARRRVEDSLDRDPARRDALLRLRLSNRAVSELARPAASPATARNVLEEIARRGIEPHPAPALTFRRRPFRVVALGGALAAAAILFVVVLPRPGTEIVEVAQNAQPVEDAPDAAEPAENAPRGPAPAQQPPAVPDSSPLPVAEAVETPDPASLVPTELADFRRDLSRPARVVRINVAPLPGRPVAREEVDRIVQESRRIDSRYGRFEPGAAGGPIVAFVGDRHEVDALLDRLRGAFGAELVAEEIPGEARAKELRGLTDLVSEVILSEPVLPSVETPAQLLTQKAEDELTSPARTGAGKPRSASHTPRPREPVLVYLTIGAPAPR
jgi:hypothetical protein